MIKVQPVLKQVEVLGHHLSIYGTWGNPLFDSKEVCVLTGYSPDASGVGCFVKPAADDDRPRGAVFVKGKAKQVSMLTLGGFKTVLDRWQYAYPNCKEVKEAVFAALATHTQPTSIPMSDAEILAKAIVIAKRIIDEKNAAIRQHDEVSTKLRQISSHAKEIQYLASQAK